LSLDLSSITPGESPDGAADGTIDLSIQQIDVQLEPSNATFDPPSQQLNISTRVKVGTGDNVLIGGFIVTGTDAKLVILRVLGPSLTRQNVTSLTFRADRSAARKNSLARPQNDGR